MQVDLQGFSKGSSSWMAF